MFYNPQTKSMRDFFWLKKFVNNEMEKSLW